LLVGSGCASDARSKNDDPLAGGGPAIPLRTEPVAGATATRGLDTAPTTASQHTSVPALPVPSSATSNAALASGAFQPLDPTRELRIGNGDANATSGTWRGPAEGTKATLNPSPPVPNRGNPGQLASSTPTPQPVNNTSGASADALLTLLQARGVTWHRLETAGDTGEWKYSCSVPNPTNPNIRRTYEARGRDPRTAMAAVLTQMDLERR
jgi:hypothetical protein